MTDRTEKLRALSLSVVVVLSVFAGVTAVSGQATAANVNVTATDWAEFQNDTRNTGNNSNVAGPVTDTSARWVGDTDGPVRSSPAVVDDTLYVGSFDGRLYAANTTDGTERWNVSTGDAIQSSPAVANGTVYVGSRDSTMYALNATDGSQEWTEPTGNAIDSSSTVVNDTVYVGNDGGNLFAFDATDGSVRWNVPTGSSAIDSSPAVVNETNTVYIGTDSGNISALDAVDGSWKWNYTTGDEVNSSPAVVNDTVYIGSNDGTIYALNATDGTEQWTNPIDPNGQIVSSPAVDATTETVYVGASNGQVVALNGTAINGSIIWNTQTSLNVTSSPALVNDTNTVYVGSDDGRVYGLDAADGSTHWTYTIPTFGESAVKSSPAVANDTVYIGSDDGNIYALGKLATINGTLTDENNNPVQGATIEFNYADGSSFPDNVATSDTNGDFSFTVPDATRNYGFRIDSPDYAIAEESSISAANNQTSTRDVTLIEGGLINGTVTDSSGSPVSGITVETYNKTDGSFVRSGQTDSAGSYSLRVVGGTYEVVINDQNYETEIEPRVSVTDDSTTVVDFQLVETAGTGFINGTIEDSDGNPVQGANVFGRDASYTNFPGGITDSNGDFSLETPEGEYTVRAEASGHAPEVREDVTVTENQTTDLSITLQQPGYINGTVTDASGNSVQGFVVVETGGDVFPGKVDPQTGEYNITVPPGTHRVSVFARGETAPSRSVSVSSSEVNTTDFQTLNTSVVHDSVEITSGSGDESKLEIRTALRNGFLQTMLVDSGNYSENGLGTPSELENISVDDDTQFRMNITVKNFSANSLLWGLDDADWETSTNESVTNGTDITITGSPATMQVNESQGANLPFGPLVGQDPSEVQWSTGTNDRATDGRNQTVYIGLFDLSTVPAEVQNALSGMSVTTNAQTFSIPSVRNDSLRVWVAAPSLTTEGDDHSGFYQADIPQAQLDDWGVSDPESDLNVRYKNSPAEATITDMDDGARIRIDNISYSAGFAEIEADPTDGGDDGGGDGGTSTGGGGGGGGGLTDPDSPEVTTTQTDDGTEATIEAVAPDATVSVDVEGASTDAVSVTGASATFKKGTNTESTMSISASASPPSDTPSPPAADTVVGYVTVDVDGSLADDVSEGRFTLDVSGSDIDPATVTAHRYDGSEWNEVETDPVDETTVEVISSDGYSPFAIGASESAEPDEPTATPTAVETETPTATATPSDEETAEATPTAAVDAETPEPTATATPTPTPGASGPGFGVLIALVAILAVLARVRLEG